MQKKLIQDKGENGPQDNPVAHSGVYYPVLQACLAEVTFYEFHNYFRSTAQRSRFFQIDSTNIGLKSPPSRSFRATLTEK